jgi:hypothetical protein
MALPAAAVQITGGSAIRLSATGAWLRVLPMVSAVSRFFKVSTVQN